MTHGVKWKPWLYSIIGAVIGSFTLGRVFGELEPFFHNGQHQFSVSVDTWKTGVNNWEFCYRMKFWGARVISTFFHNGWHQFSVAINTQKTGDPNFGGVGNWVFCSRTCFWGARAIFPFFYNGRHQFSVSVDTQKTMMTFLHLKVHDGRCKFSVGSVFLVTMHHQHSSVVTLKTFMHSHMHKCLKHLGVVTFCALFAEKCPKIKTGSHIYV